MSSASSELEDKLKNRRVVVDSPDYIVQNIPAASTADAVSSSSPQSKLPVGKVAKSSSSSAAAASASAVGPSQQQETGKKKKKVFWSNVKGAADPKSLSPSRMRALALCYVLPLAISAAFSLFYQIWTPYRFMYVTPSVPVTVFEVKPLLTTWRPQTRRDTVPYAVLTAGSVDPSLAMLVPKVSRTQSGGLTGSNMVWNVAAPMFTLDWVRESQMYIFNGGPTFDDDGNLFFTPLNPGFEDVSLVCLDSVTGDRRWQFRGTGPGSGAPLVLPSLPNFGYRAVYHATRTTIWALRALDGAVLWSGVTGIPPSDFFDKNRIEGLVYRPQSDSVVGITADGIVFAVSRERGELIAEPRKIPCVPPPKTTRVETDITSVQESASAEMQSVFGTLANGRVIYSQVLSNPLLSKTSPDQNDTSGGGVISGILSTVIGSTSGVDGETDADILAGSDPDRSMSCVAGSLSVNPLSGRIFVSGTTSAGQGALFAIDILTPEQLLLLQQQQAGASAPTTTRDKYPYRIRTMRAALMSGGAGTPPAISEDGRLVVYGDRKGQVIALSSETLEQIWSYDVGSDVIGGVALSPGVGLEIYVTTKNGELIKLVESAPAFQPPGFVFEAWRADLTPAFESGGYYYGVRPAADSKPTVTANGIALLVSARVERAAGEIFSAKVGVALVDRETGILTHFALGKEEGSSVAVGLDGSLYVAHAPIRRAESRAVWGSKVDPLVGGIARFKPTRLDLVGRDAACMAATIAENAASYLRGWISDDQVSLDAAVTDLRQVASLAWQAMLSRSMGHNSGEIHEDVTGDMLDRFAMFVKEAIDLLGPSRGGVVPLDPSTTRSILKSVIAPLRGACNMLLV